AASRFTSPLALLHIRFFPTRRSSDLALAAALVASPFLTSCIPVIVAAGVGGATLVATDRRSVGAQADDEAIELKIANSVNARYRSEEHTSELQSPYDIVCRLLLATKK